MLQYGSLGKLYGGGVGGEFIGCLNFFVQIFYAGFFSAKLLALIFLLLGKSSQGQCRFYEAGLFAVHEFFLTQFFFA